jgi:hypothetical protein
VESRAALGLRNGPSCPYHRGSVEGGVVDRMVGLELDYTFPDPAPGQPAPAKLVVTINSADDRLPPASESFDLTGASAAGLLRRSDGVPVSTGPVAP